MSVSLSEVLAGAEAQAVPLSAECAGYLVLAAADQAALSPRRVQAGEVCLLDDGAVRLLGGVPSDDATAEGDLRELLGGLLSSASSTTAGLMRARRRAAGAGVGALLRELERALIPVNRSAARRALARLARETVRAKDEGRLAPAPLPAFVPPPPVVESAPVPIAAPPVVESAPVPVAAPPLVATAPPPSVAPPVIVETDPGLTQVIPRVEVTERLVLPVVAAIVAAEPAHALVEASAPAPAVVPREESETRPEPVVLRASQRPPAMPEQLDAVPPPAHDLAPTGDTPVLGTVLAPSLVAEEPRLSVAELAQALATPVPPDDELDIDVEVTFALDESTMTPEDVELILLADDGEELERTEPCPSPPLESIVPPEVVAASDVELPAEVASASDAELPDEVSAASEIEPPPELASASAIVLADDVLASAGDIELPDDVLASAPEASLAVEAPEPGTVLPPWVMSRPEEPELSPPPRVAVTRRQSNVEDLLERMTREPAEVDDVRSGLKSLAGLEPTPPPPGTIPGD